MMEWQPIETAPRDGTQILALVASPYMDDQSTYHILSWQKGWPSRFEGHPSQPDCWWANENGANYHEPYVQKWAPLPERKALSGVPMLERSIKSYSLSEMRVPS